MSEFIRPQDQQLRSSADGARLCVRLLGPMTVTIDGGPVAIPAKRARALLGYLVLREGIEVARNVVTGLLWGERGESQARASLRQTLSELRGLLGASGQDAIIATKETIRWASGSAWIDAKALEAAAGSDDENVLRHAATLAAGELMEGLAIGEAAFEQWLAGEREHFRLIASKIYTRLMALAERRGALEEVLTSGLKLIALDPLQEHVHRALMRTYAAQGRHDAALAQYERCRQELATQLSVSPEPETEELARSIRGSRHSGTAKPVGAPEVSRGPDNPSIAVLPFANIGGDLEQDYFADGIVEEIITALSRIHWLFVIARNSSFIFKGHIVDVKQVGRELGVRYVLEGSVRKAGDRVRIASQLIDATSGTHIWADHFDGALRDIFDLQDQITAKVVGAIEPKLRRAEIERARRKPTASIDAYDLFLRAVALNNTRKEIDNKEALRLLYRAVEIDPQYAAAYALASYCYLRQKVQGFASSAGYVLVEGMRMARLAAEHGSDDPEALWMAGVTMSILAGEADDGLALIDRSLALNPNSANGLMASGLVRAVVGDIDSALPPLHRSRQLSPLDPIAYGTSLGFAWAYFMVGRYEDASAACDRTLREAPTYYPPALQVKIACCGLLGQQEEGRKWVERLLSVNPEASVSSLYEWFRLYIKKPAGLEAVLEGMRKAGMPE